MTILDMQSIVHAGSEFERPKPGHGLKRPPVLSRGWKASPLKFWYLCSTNFNIMAVMR